MSAMSEWALEVAQREDYAKAHAVDLLIALERIKNMLRAEIVVIAAALAAISWDDDAPPEERVLTRTIVSGLRDQQDILQRLLNVATETDFHDPPLA